MVQSAETRSSALVPLRASAPASTVIHMLQARDWVSVPSLMRSPPLQMNVPVPVLLCQRPLSIPCAAVLTPVCMSPSTAVMGSAVPFFHHANLSTALLLAHSASSVGSGLAFSHLFATLPGRMFAPPSSTSLGLTHAEELSEMKFWAEIMPRIALADVFIPGAPLDNLRKFSQVLASMCLVFVFRLFVCFPFPFVCFLSVFFFFFGTQTCALYLYLFVCFLFPFVCFLSVFFFFFFS